MAIVSDNLRIIINELNTSQTDFARRVGTSFGYINMVLNGRRVSISKTLALLIEEVFGYSADWLLKNKGQKMKNWFKSFVKENPDFIEILEKLDLSDQKLVIDFINSLNADEETKRRKRMPKYKNI